MEELFTSAPLMGLDTGSIGESSIFSNEVGCTELLLVLCGVLFGDPGEVLLGLDGGDSDRATGNKLLMLNFPRGEDWGGGGKVVMGLEIGGNILDATEVAPAEDVKLPLTSCSNDPRIDELPSEFPPSLVSDLLPALLSLLPLGVEAVSVMVALRKRGLPTHCCM